MARTPTDPAGRLKREITLLDLDLNRAAFAKDCAATQRIANVPATKRAELEALQSPPPASR